MKLEVGRSYWTASGQEVEIWSKVDYDPLYRGRILNSGSSGVWMEDGHFPEGEPGDPLSWRDDSPMRLVKEAPRSIVPPKARHECVGELEAMVAEFNRKFAVWMDRTGCVANFGWKYSGDAPKQMSIEGIDAQVYKKPEPGWAKQMGAATSKLGDLAKEPQKSV